MVSRGPASWSGNGTGRRNRNATWGGAPEDGSPTRWGGHDTSDPDTGDPDTGGRDTRDRDTRGEDPGRDPEAKARQICLRLLTIAPRTRAQLSQAMRRGGVTAETAEAVLDRFTDVGLIDDAAFGRAWVESRHYSRGLSRRSLSAELRQRGLDGEEIREAVDTLDPEQEIATARRLVERKLASSRGRPAEARVRQAAGLLARKGYPAGLVFRLIRESMEQEKAEGSGDVLDLDADQYLDPDA